MNEQTTVTSFAAEARAWLEENFEPRRPEAVPVGRGGYSSPDDEVLAGQRALQRKLFENGFAGITWPTHLGGRGLTREYEQAFDEVAAAFVMPNLGIAGETTMKVCGPTLLQHASEEFLLRHAPAMLAGDELWVQFFSEPDAGSDLAAVRTRAERDGEGWALHGSKIWTSGAAYADFGMCLTRTAWDVPKHQGLTWFAVPTTAPGVTIRPIKEINGSSEFCEELFTGVYISDDERIGDVNDGWRVARSMLVHERSANESVDGPPLQGQRPIAPDLVELARRSGRLNDAVVQQLIARAHTNDLMQEQLAEWVAVNQDSGHDVVGMSSYLKLAAGTYTPIRASIAMEIAGDTGVVWDADSADGASVAIAYLNGRILSIAGGTNEMQRNAIGERVLGLPREPSFDSTKSFREVLSDATSWSGRS
jgi:alkylation response protein AidB-like acyl-CoA dehydrogenase